MLNILCIILYIIMTSLPRNLIFDRKITASYAKCYKSNIQPQNGTSGYNLGDTITINIPTRMGLNMDTLNSGLKFGITFTPGATLSTARWDSCGAHGLIQRLVVKHGSNVWEDINNYGMVVKELYDLQIPFSSNYGKNSILAGTRNDLVVDATNANQVRQVNSGDIIFSNVGDTNTVKRFYFLNLVSIVGALCNQNYLPNWAFTSASIVIEITLVDSILKAAATSAVAPTVAFDSVEFVASFVELNPQAMDIVLKANNGRVELPYTSLKNFTYSTTVAGGSQITIPIPAKYTSLKGIVCSQRSTTGASTIFPYSSIVNFVSSYQFRVGALTVPGKAVDNLVEQFAEVCKVFGGIGDIQYSPNIDWESYSLYTNTANVVATRFASVSGSWYCGIDMESYPNADKSKMFAGYDSRTDDIYLNVSYASADVKIGTVTNAIAGIATNPRWDIFVFFDQTLISEMGTGYVQY